MGLSTDEWWRSSNFLGRLVQAMDDDGDGFAARFATDGVLDTSAARVAGRPAPRKFVADRHPARAGSRHVVGSVMVDPDGTAARARSYGLFLPTGTGGPLTVVYEDSVVRVDGAWLVSRRRIVETREMT